MNSKYWAFEVVPFMLYLHEIRERETEKLFPLSLWLIHNIFFQIFPNLGIHWVVYQRVPECVRVCKPKESIIKRISCKMFPFCSNRIWVTERCSPNKDCVDVAKCRIGQSKCRTQHQLINWDEQQMILLLDYWVVLLMKLAILHKKYLSNNLIKTRQIYIDFYNSDTLC